jgi:aminopeptidase
MKTVETHPKRQLSKVAFDPELTPGAQNAVRVCLRVQPSEKVTLITDEVSLEIAAAIARELEAVGCSHQAWPTAP